MAPTESGQPRLDDRLAQLLALSDRAYLLAVRMLGSREGAEDVVQHAYLGAVRALRGSAAPERPEAWFLGAVVHAARNYLRTENRRRRKEAVMIARQVAGGAERAAPEGSEMAAALRTAIAALDEKYRGPLCLCCEQGLSRREAAGILGLPERTVSKHVGEALERLKRALAAGGYAAATPAAVLAVLKVVGETVPVTLAGALQSLLSNAAALGAPGAASAGATAAVAKAAGLSLAWKLAAAASIAVIVGAGTVAGMRHFGAVAGADPALPGPSALPANAWVQAPDSDELKRLKELRAALSAAHRPKGSDWLFVEGWPVYSAGGGGVWLPERKAAFFVTGNVYENPPCNAYLYDPAATGKVAKVAWGAASGWKRLDPGGDRISGTLRWASLGYDPVNREVLLCGGNSAERSGSPGTMTYDPGKNVWKRLDFSARPLFKVHADCEELRLAAQALEGRLRSRVHLAETAEEAKEDLAKLAKDL
jgi:RNA polymerase sigma factor (sigma-70 family)